MSQTQEQLFAESVETALRTLECHVRSVTGCVSACVQSEISRTHHGDVLGAPRPAWTVTITLDDASRRMVQGYGSTYALALADVNAKAAAIRSRCPTCGHQHAACPPAAPSPESDIEKARRHA